MRIKEHYSGNKYILTPEKYWVRDFTKHNLPCIDINKLYSDNDSQIVIVNELENNKRNKLQIEGINVKKNKWIIVSDGYRFKEKHLELANIPNSVGVIAVNGALAGWNLVGEQIKKKRSIDFYVVNNPYKECMSYMPKKHRYFPHCIASTRTNQNFMKEYKGHVSYYCPSLPEKYNSICKSVKYKIDDYRNPICAAIEVAYKFGAVKILLYCCDDVFEIEKPTAEKLDNGLYQYPQQRICQNIIDGKLYWLRENEVDIANHSSVKFENSTYINQENITSWIN